MDKISCPECTGTNVSKNGKSEKGEQRYLCKDDMCDAKSFKLKYIYNGCKPGIHEQILNGRLDDSSIREIAEELGLSKQKVQDTLQEIQHQMDCLCKGCAD